MNMEIIQNKNIGAIPQQISGEIVAPENSNSMVQAVQSTGKPKGLRIFNVIINSLMVITLLATLAICLYFFNKGGDSIWISILVAPVSGGAVYLSLVFVKYLANIVYFFIKK